MKIFWRIATEAPTCKANELSQRGKAMNVLEMQCEPVNELLEQHVRSEAIARDGAKLLIASISISLDASYCDDWQAATEKRDRAVLAESNAYKMLALVDFERARILVAEAANLSKDPMMENHWWIDVKKHRAAREAALSVPPSGRSGG